MIIKSEQEMLNLGTQFANNIISNPKSPLVIELVGDVGAGKTTFARGLAKGLGIKEPITSPSFTISKSYALKNGGRFIHYDFYRLSDPGIMTEDLQENLTNPQNIILIEWGESVTDLLPKNHLTITINYTKTGNREVII